MRTHFYHLESPEAVDPGASLRASFATLTSVLASAAVVHSLAPFQSARRQLVSR